MISRLDGLLSVGSTGGRDYDRAESLGQTGTTNQPTESARVELMQRAQVPTNAGGSGRLEVYWRTGAMLKFLQVEKPFVAMLSGLMPLPW